MRYRDDHLCSQGINDVITHFRCLGDLATDDHCLTTRHSLGWMDDMRNVFAMVFLFLGAIFPAQSATNEDAAKTRGDYDKCVYFSVADQLKNRSIHDLSMVTENGFLACRSEEAVLRTFMRKELFLSPEFIETSILKIRLSIKRHVREIANNPQIVDGQPASAAHEAGGYLVQVSSRRNKADAQASYRALQGKFPAMLGSRAPLITRADLSEHGVFYRAMVGPFATPDEASQFCANLKSAGGQCVVQRR